MQPLTRYWQAHQGVYSPLPVIHDHVRAHGVPDAAAVQALALKAGLPESAVRGVVSYYADLHAPSHVPRFCTGTSCLLAGGAQIKDALNGHSHCQAVHCLGHCDASPVVMDADGALFTGEGARAFAPGKPATVSSHQPVIRNRAREPIVTRRILRGDFSPLSAARADGAYRALEQALQGTQSDVLAAMERSGERGRGGAGFPTGAKWRMCAETAADERFVIANGDEGDPGSFIDRVLMERDPHGVLEGLALCAYAVGARRGILFIRSEYPRAIAVMREAAAEARAAGLFGGIAGGHGVEMSVFPALGSYVCGEETALLNAIEGLRGEVRIRPPYPAQEGLYGKPTVINNVETLVNVPFIVQRGGAAYAALGTKESRGTKALCLNHGFARPGIVEVEFGESLRTVIEDMGGGGAGGRRIEAVLLGGPMGSVLMPDEWDVPICHAAMAAKGIRLGHGGLVALLEGTDYRGLFEHLLRFMMEESCGKCVPCRLGSRAAWNTLHHANGHDPRPQLRRLCEVMEQGSLCAFGQNMPGPLLQLMDRFGERIFPADAKGGTAKP